MPSERKRVMACVQVRSLVPSGGLITSGSQRSLIMVGSEMKTRSPAAIEISEPGEIGELKTVGWIS